MPDEAMFEHRLAALLRRDAATSDRPFDPDAIAQVLADRRRARPRLALPTRRRRPTGRPMLVLPVAFLLPLAAIALASGALLFTTGQRSPSPPSVVDPFAGFVTEEVEPGVIRIVNDGVRELAWLPQGESPYRSYDNAIGLGPDGSTWLFRPDGYFRVGSAPTYPRGRSSGPRGRVQVTADQATVLWDIDGGLLIRAEPDWDPEGWWSPQGPGTQVAVDPSGAIWVASTDLAGRITLTHSERYGEPWIAHDFPGSGGRVSGLWASDGGVAWMAVELEGDEEFALWRYHDTGWEQLHVPTQGTTHIDVGQDGTVWAWGWVKAEEDVEHWSHGEARANWARLDDGAWTTLGAVGDVTYLSNAHDGGARHTVAPDGSVWFNPGSYDAARGSPCDGLARFDGTSVLRFLQPLCVFNLAIGSDGTAWVLAGQDPWVHGLDTLVETYVIRPEAAMARRPSPIPSPISPGS